MRLVGVACAKNEIDIIEAFVRHNLALLDALVVLDNGSGDGTLAVLRALCREGLPLEVVEDPLPGYYQAERMTALMRRAFAELGADWVFPLDADEFLMPTTGPLIPADAATSQLYEIYWKSYVPGNADNASERNPAVRIVHRLAVEPCLTWKVVIGRELGCRGDAQLYQGSHYLYLGEQRQAARPLRSVQLAHFPVRGPGHHLAKTAICFLQHFAVAGAQTWSRDSKYFKEWEELKANPLRFAERYRRTALHYPDLPPKRFEPRTVVEPMPYRGGPLRYTPVIEDWSLGLQRLMHYTEELALRNAVLAEGLAAEPAAVESRVHRLGQMRPQVASAIDHLKQSWDWRIGRLILSPLRWLRRFIWFRSLSRRLSGNRPRP